MKKQTVTHFFFIVMLLWITPVQAETLYLSIAASMTDSFKEILSLYTSNNRETKFLTNFGSSGSLAKQIALGAPSDIYVSANPHWMKYLVDEGVVDTSRTKIIATTNLVFIGNPALQTTKLEHLSSLRKISIGTPQSVPAGQYAKQALEMVNLYKDLKTNKKLVMAKDVRQALLYADRGEVDGSFVYETDARLAKSCKILFAVPAKLYNKVKYPIGLTTNGVKKKAAVKFYEFLSTEPAIQVLQKHGFRPPA